MQANGVSFAKLIRLLASDNEGEVLGAARAIRRKLEASGHSIHELAGTIIGRIMELPPKVIVLEKPIEVPSWFKEMAAPDTQALMADLHRQFEPILVQAVGTSRDAGLNRHDFACAASVVLVAYAWQVVSLAGVSRKEFLGAVPAVVNRKQGPTGCVT
jgi:hypothetical protein